MTATLQSRFLAAEQDLLSAFCAGEESLVAFADTWAALLTTAKEMQQLNPDTSCLMHSVASRVSVLADSLLSLDSRASQLQNEFSNRFVAILEQAEQEPSPDSSTSPDSLMSPSSSTSTSSSTSPSSLTSPSSPASSPYSSPHSLRSALKCHSNPPNDTSGPSHSLDSLAKDWLLCNLHDPYPSNPQKIEMAGRCQCSVKDVQEWFSSVRRRIGWTALASERFHGSRRATSESACLAYSMHGDSCLPPDLLHAFAVVKLNAQSLRFDEICCNDDASLDLDTSSEICHDIASCEVMGKGAGLPMIISSQDFNQAPRSFEAFPTSPSLFADAGLNDEDEDTTPPPPVAGCKRRVDASLDSVDEGLEWSTSFPTGVRPLKRHRCTGGLSNTDEQTSPMIPREQYVWPMEAAAVVAQSPGFPGGPPIDVCDTSTVTSHIQPVNDVTLAEVTPPSSSPVPFSTSASVSTFCPRKRRLSDAGLSGSPKRLRSIRKQIVSDPLPSNSNNSNNIGTVDWLNPIPDGPNTVEAADSKPSVSADTELDAFSAVSDNPIYSLPFAGPPLQLDVSHAEVVSSTMDGFDLSSCNFIGTANARSLQDDFVQTFTGDGSPSSSLSHFCSFSELSDHEPVDSSCVDWNCDWSRFLDIVNSLDASPTPSLSSLSQCSVPSQNTQGYTFQSSLEEIPFIHFGVDPSFTPFDLADVDGLSSLPIPLDTAF